MSTYSVQDAIQFVRAFVKNIPVSDVQLIAADQINSEIWMSYPWRWSIAELTAIPLVDATQDYAPVAPITDYFRLVRARIVRTDTTPNQALEPLTIVNKLEPKFQVVSPHAVSLISYEGHLSKFRLERPVQIGATDTWELRGEYQTQPTKLGTTSALFPFPDQYLEVMTTGLAWKFYDLVGDQRAGIAQSNGRGGVAYTGMLGAFRDQIYMMACAEGYAAGDTVAPSESLMAE